MNNNFGNILLVVILVLIVGFGVWYVTMREAAPEPGNGIQLNIEGGSEEGAN